MSDEAPCESPPTQDGRPVPVSEGHVEGVMGPDGYGAVLVDKYRPPSRGGNTKAWHSHGVWVNGERYGFLALGTKKWIFVGDSFSFDWKLDPTGNYRNIDEVSLRVLDKNGKPVIRGHRGGKRWRTASTRMPVSRREMRD
jgi:hypothetical protein